MKKVFGILAIAGLFVATSCSKVYTCEIGGVTTEWSEKDYEQSVIDAAKVTCELAGGTWSTK